MIPRYLRPEIQSIWDIENKYKNWLEIELLICEAQESIGVLPEGVTKRLRAKAGFDIKRIDLIDKEIKHDVVAFLTSVSEHVGDDARFLHMGVTSSDVIDTAFSLQLMQAADVIIADLEKVLRTLRTRIFEYKETICVGRSHGIHAEPTTFGLKLAGHYAAFVRAKARMLMARKEIATCGISGPVGTYSSIDPRVESYVAEKLGLEIETVSSQVIPRDRHAMFFSVLAITAASIENLALEIRHLQRTEVREVEEKFEEGQKGSSSMPHKRNPILSENLTGLSRLIRSAVTPALENVALWHERDVSHSSVERVIAPDTTAMLNFALNRLNELISNLVVYPKRMRENLESLNGLVFSQPLLLALVKGGMKRDYAHRLVQEISDKVMRGDGQNFMSLALEDETVAEYIDQDTIKSLFDYRRCIERTADVINRVLDIA